MTDEKSRDSAQDNVAERRFCTFELCTELFGVAVEKVQEIIRYQAMTPVPQAPPTFAGLINLRGEIVPAIDMRRCMGLEQSAEDFEPTNVVVRTDDGAVSLLVDDIGEVADVSAEVFEQAPDNLHGTTREMIRCVYKLEKRLLMVLDVDEVIRLAMTDVGGLRAASTGL